MQINGVPIVGSFAEAFDMVATRLLITAANSHWADVAARTATGFGTSVIGCGVEAGIESQIQPSDTVDGRPGVSILLFGMSRSELAKQVVNRVGQCVLTCPTTAIFSGLSSGDKIELGSKLRFFGDGQQISKLIGSHRYWRIPVMDGEFVCEDSAFRIPAIGGGNFLVMAKSVDGALAACQDAVEAIQNVENVITPFPGGIARSGSKVGSKYAALHASTNDAFCPSLKELSETQIPDEANAVLEVVIDGLDFESIAEATAVGIKAATKDASQHGIVGITAGNYGGNLGKHHFRLVDICSHIAD